MIYDTVEHLMRYRFLFSCHEELEPAFEAILQSLQEDTMILGRTDITERVYINVMEYDTKPLAEGQFETHRDYADVQLLLEGREYLNTSTADVLTQTAPYQSESECSLQKGPVENRTELRPGTFALLLPGEPHMPGIQLGQSATVKKMVIKIKVS